MFQERNELIPDRCQEIAHTRDVTNAVVFTRWNMLVLQTMVTVTTTTVMKSQKQWRTMSSLTTGIDERGLSGQIEMPCT